MFEVDKEMMEQSKRNGYKENPNFSNARYAEHPEMEIKRKAFDSKEGYAGSYSEHCKDRMGGLPLPPHMRGK